MGLSNKKHGYLLGALLSALAFGIPSRAEAAPCADLNPVNPIYGAGGSAVTATLSKVAQALVSLPEEERVTVFFYDPGACAGYGLLVTPTGTPTFKTWDAAGVQTTCEAPATNISFAHMGNTPLLCPGNAPLPAGFARHVAPVQTINFITGPDSSYDSISAEALYHIYGLGPGATDHGVAPWLVPNAVYGRTVSSFVHQIVAAAIGVPATGFKIPSASPNNFLSTNPLTVAAVFAVSDDETALGYVSGSAADKGEEDGQVKTLAYQHYDQSCGYLPDSSPLVKDKINVRTGQYYLWTPAWFYTKVNSDGKAVAQDGTTLVPLVENLIHWFDGSLASPDGIDIPGANGDLHTVTDIVIDSGDIPLCAMQAIRPDGDLSPIQSFAPDKPCNGYFETVATGSTDHDSCTKTSDCTGENEKCFFGFCEVTYPETTN
jgi:hypothetical protein